MQFKSTKTMCHRQPAQRTAIQQHDCATYTYDTKITATTLTGTEQWNEAVGKPEMCTKVKTKVKAEV